MLSTAYLNTVEVGFRESGMRSFSTELYYCEELKPPTRKTKGRQTHQQSTLRLVALVAARCDEQVH